MATVTTPNIPQLIPNLSVWIDADNATSYTLTSGAVSNLQDCNGVLPDFAQATTANRPTTTGTPVKFVFDGTNDNLQGSSKAVPLSYEPHHVFAVFTRVDTATSSFRHIWGITDAFGIGYGTYANKISVARAGASDTRTTGTFTGSTLTLASFGTGGIDYNGSLVTRVRINAGSEESLTVTGYGTVAPGIGVTHEIGGRGTVEVHYGQIAEILVYSAELAPTHREIVEGYLAHKWGISGSLPAGHPYKTTAPSASMSLPDGGGSVRITRESLATGLVRADEPTISRMALLAARQLDQPTISRLSLNVALGPPPPGAGGFAHAVWWRPRGKL